MCVCVCVSTRSCVRSCVSRLKNNLRRKVVAMRLSVKVIQPHVSSLYGRRLQAGTRDKSVYEENVSTLRHILRHFRYSRICLSFYNNITNSYKVQNIIEHHEGLGHIKEEGLLLMSPRRGLYLGVSLLLITTNFVIKLLVLSS